MSDQQVDQGKRTWLIATGCAGAVGGVATAVPFVSTFAPSERAKAAGAPVEVDVSKLEPGAMMKVEWRGQPIYVVRRTPEMLETVKKGGDKVADPDSKKVMQPAYAKNELRSIKPEEFVDRRGRLKGNMLALIDLLFGRLAPDRILQL